MILLMTSDNHPLGPTAKHHPLLSPSTLTQYCCVDCRYQPVLCADAVCDWRGEAAHRTHPVFHQTLLSHWPHIQGGHHQLWLPGQPWHMSAGTCVVALLTLRYRDQSLH